MNRLKILWGCFIVFFAFISYGYSGSQPIPAPIKVLIIDGQNNHDWKATTPVLKRILEDSGLFAVDIATSPPQGSDMSGFNPPFNEYRVILLNYNGDLWPQKTQNAFIEYVRNGGGVVTVHAADNSFPEWNEYNRINGLGGWGDRNEKFGPYVRLRNGKFVRDYSPGIGGSHGERHAFKVVIRDTSHPITKGLPAEWMHVKDELYDRLRGPAEDLDVLATAYSAPVTRGTGEHEPILMTIRYHKGRIFHTVLGHDTEAMSCVGFITTLLRGAEWAATGKVIRTAVPADFPSADSISTRQIK